MELGRQATVNVGAFSFPFGVTNFSFLGCSSFHTSNIWEAVADSLHAQLAPVVGDGCIVRAMSTERTL